MKSKLLQRMKQKDSDNYEDEFEKYILQYIYNREFDVQSEIFKYIRFNIKYKHNAFVS